jgi:alkanesulfonate monooxygenase SsuD/methylene tetrahydromethanopterin reductase-like flavin-dependent oxidoreductase (luciferase family)
VTEPRHIHVGVALDGAGWHPAAWREPDSRPDDLLSAGYWVDLARQAEAGLLEFLTIEDALRLQSDHPFHPDQRTDRVRGQLDSVLIASRIAPATGNIGLIPTVVVTHTEPFHTSKAIATLDYVSKGRGGLRVRVSTRLDEARHFGRREFPEVDLRRRDEAAAVALVSDLFDEAEDYVEVVRRLWDSWEDDAEIRDVATGRFVDRDKLHYIDFAGRWFSVRGPSITPRPPQGQPLVAALGHASRPYQLLARSTDLGFITPTDQASAAAIVEEIRRETNLAGRPPDAVRVFADVVVFLGDTPQKAGDRKARLDQWAGVEYRTDAVIFTGTAAQLADLIEDWATAGLSGFRLRPGSLPHDLIQITDKLVPELQKRGIFRQEYEEPTLRGRFGLDGPANRYVTA